MKGFLNGSVTFGGAIAAIALIGSVYWAVMVLDSVSARVSLPVSKGLPAQPAIGYFGATAASVSPVLGVLVGCAIGRRTASWPGRVAAIIAGVAVWMSAGLLGAHLILKGFPIAQ